MGRANRLNLFAFLVAGATLLPAMGGCAGDGVGTYDPMDPRLMQAHLEYVSDAAQTLRQNAIVDLSVKYVYADASPVSGAPISFALVGEVGGSSLSALSTETASNGVATVQLRTANADAHFRVRATPPQGTPLEFDVSVANRDLGGIVVTMAYPGMQTFSNFRPFLFHGVACSSFDPFHLPTADRAGTAVAHISDNPSFAGLEAGATWVVAVVADIGTEAKGFGCADNIAVMNGRNTTVPITLSDITPPSTFDGTYDLQNRINFAGILPPTAEVAVNIIAELSDDNDVNGNIAAEEYGQDPGAFLVDFAMRQTCHWQCARGQNYETCTQTNHGYGDLRMLYTEEFATWDGAQPRFTGGCGAWETAYVPAQNFINEQINRLIPSAVIKLATIAGDVARAMNDARIKSELTVSTTAGTNQVAMSHRLVSMDVPLHRLDGTEFTYTMDLAMLGFSSIRATGNATAEGNTLRIPAHSFTLNWGRLVQYIYLHGLLPILGYTTTADLLRSWIDCNALASRLQMSVGILSEDQWRSSCNTGVSAIGRLIEAELAALVSGNGTLTLMGTANGADLGPDRTARRLEAGMWTGAWGEPSMTAGMSVEHAVTGTFTGTLHTAM